MLIVVALFRGLYLDQLTDSLLHVLLIFHRQVLGQGLDHSDAVWYSAWLAFAISLTVDAGRLVWQGVTRDYLRNALYQCCNRWLD